MDKFFAPLFALLSAGPLRFVLIGISLVTILLTVVTMLGEITGNRFSFKERKFVKTGLKWDATNIAIAAICAAIYTGGRFLQTPQIVPGFGGLTLTHVLAPIIALLFGIPGAVGVAVSVPFGDYLFGYFGIGSMGGFSGHWMALTYIPFLLINDPSMRNKVSIIKIYLVAILLASFWHAITISGFLDLLRLAPTEVCWGVIAPGVIVAHGVIPAILMPILMLPLYPAVKSMGLYWKDRKVKFIQADK